MDEHRPAGMPEALDIADGVRVLRHVRIPARDGVRLAADVYLPGPGAAHVEHGRWPAIIMYQPYRKDDVYNAGGWQHRFPRAGYAFVQLDVRGTGASEGTNDDEYLPIEQTDGHDALEWLARQPWCDGQTNLIGSSYSGFTALQVATHQPPSLRSLVTLFFTDDRYTDDCHYRGGLLGMYYDAGYYGTLMVAENALPPDPDLGSDWTRIWEEHLAGMAPYQLTWLRNQRNGPYWRGASVADTVERIAVPCYLVGGWRDGYPNPPLRLYEQLRVPRKLLVGPWNHAAINSAMPGPRIDEAAEFIRWFDHWNRPGAGVTDVMAEPPVTFFLQRAQPPIVDRVDSAGEWRSEVAWPVPGVTERTLWLAAAGGLADAPPDELAEEWFDYRATLGAASGGLWSGGLPYGTAGDQRPDDAWSLVHLGEPIADRLAIVGRPVVWLRCASSASVAAFVIRLLDVAPDGTRELIAKGVLNATRRRSTFAPEPIVPGEPMELRIELDATAWAFEPGHRIGLAIAGADFPNLWPTPEAARNTVLLGGERASRLTLPVVPAAGSADPPTFRPSPTSVGPLSLATEPPTWTHRVEVLTGREHVDMGGRRRWRTGSGTIVDRSYAITVTADPGDPAHASVRGVHHHRITGATGTVEAVADASITSTPTDVHATFDLRVTVNGAPHLQRRWVETVPRDLL